MAELILAGALLLAGVACGDDGGMPDTGAGDTGTTDTGADTGMADGGGGETISFVITDPRTETPIADAIVGLDAVDGTRLEETSGADGRVTFEGVVVSGEPGWVTTVADTFAVVSVQLTTDSLALVRENDDRLALLFPNAVDLVTVTGTITNITSATNMFTVVADAPRSVNYQAVGPDFEIQVPRDTAFTLTVLEWIGVMGTGGIDQTLFGAGAVDSAGSTADTTLDVDLVASVLPFQTASGTLPPVPAGHPLEDTLPYIIVGHRPPLQNAFYGSPTHIGENADLTAWAYDVSWIEPTTAVDPQTVYVLNGPPLFSAVVMRGFPAGGAVDLEWLSPPDIISPAFGAPHPLHDPVTFDVADSGVSFILDVFEEDSRTTHWVALAGPGSTEIALPELPASVNEDDVLPTANLVGRVRTCDLDPTDLDVCLRYTASRLFDWTR